MIMQSFAVCEKIALIMKNKTKQKKTLPILSLRKTFDISYQSLLFDLTKCAFL